MFKINYNLLLIQQIHQSSEDHVITTTQAQQGGTMVKFDLFLPEIHE